MPEELRHRRQLGAGGIDNTVGHHTARRFLDPAHPRHPQGLDIPELLGHGSAPRSAANADDPRSQHTSRPRRSAPRPAREDYRLPSATPRPNHPRALFSISSVNRTLQPGLEPDMAAGRRRPPQPTQMPLAL